MSALRGPTCHHVSSVIFIHLSAKNSTKTLSAGSSKLFCPARRSVSWSSSSRILSSVIRFSFSATARARSGPSNAAAGSVDSELHSPPFSSFNPSSVPNPVPQDPAPHDPHPPVPQPPPRRTRAGMCVS
eukprot:999399-Rhodomonas_salina.2